MTRNLRLNQRVRTTAATLTLVVVGGVTLGACGAGSNSSLSPAPSGTRQGIQAFQTCLKNHGVTLPSGQPPSVLQGGSPPPTGGFPGGSSSAIAKAMKACQSLAPAGGPPGGFGGSNG